MRYCFDIDGTICHTPCDPDGHNVRYWDAVPFPYMVEKTQEVVNEKGKPDVVLASGMIDLAASTIIYLSKKKEKDGKEVVGNIIKCKTAKARLTKENNQVEVRLYYDKGLDKHYGLLELGIHCNHEIYTSFSSQISFFTCPYFKPCWKTLNIGWKNIFWTDGNA